MSSLNKLIQQLPYPQLVFLVPIALAFLIWTVYIEIKCHYLDVYSGVVIEKQQIPPKKMPDLLISGNQTVFPTWKWEGIDFDSVQIGDSIVKRKYQPYAYYYRKVKGGKYLRRRLTYWIF